MLVLGSALALVVGSSAGVRTTSPPNVRGVVVGLESAPICPVGEPCDPPNAAAYVVFSRSGRAVRARLGASRTFALRLAAGRYAVRVAPSQRGAVSPAVVVVPRRGVVWLRLRVVS